MIHSDGPTDSFAFVVLKNVIRDLNGSLIAGQPMSVFTKSQRLVEMSHIGKMEHHNPEFPYIIVYSNPGSLGYSILKIGTFVHSMDY